MLEISAEDLEAIFDSPAEMDEVPCEEKKSKRKEVKGNYFGVILYVDEDICHQKFFNYIISRPQYQYLYIKHKGEGLNKDGKPKKDHIHLMVKTLDRMAVGSFVKFFSGWIDYAECIHDPKTYVMYLLHDTPAAIDEGKIPYSVSDLCGSLNLYRHLVQNSHFVQLNQIMTYHPFHGSFLDTYNSIPDDKKKELGDFMWSHYHIVRAEINDENFNFT